MSRTAAALVVGNEILAGKIEDTNSRLLARTLFELGIAFRRVVVCPDELDRITRDVRELADAHDFVFTSGGVGPTHDDITIDGVAAAFGREVVQSPEIARMVREHYGDKLTPAHLRMAHMPAGATLLRSGKLAWPTIVCENVYVLPGVPQIFAMKLDGLRELLDDGARFWNETVYTLCDEGEIADLLTELSVTYAEITVGSYLVFDEPDYRVRLTFDGSDPGRVKSAADDFVAGLAEGRLVKRTRTEP